MADESLLKRLSAETRSKLRSTQILTSLPTIISELLQNSIDAGTSQIDVGVDCAEWSCWVMDNGSGFTKDGLHKVGQDSEHGRYSESFASLHSVPLGEASLYRFFESVYLRLAGNGFHLWLPRRR
jgi:DNA mismatch repair protein MLH3